MRSFTSSRPSWSASSTVRASSRCRRSRSRTSPHGRSSTASSQLRTHACSGFCAPMRSNWSSSLSTAARTASGRSLLGELGPVLRGDVVVALAQLLADRVQLAAQQHLALLLVDAVGDLGADPVLQLEVGQRLARPPQHQLEARLDVDRLEQLDALLHRELGRVRGHVGQLAGVSTPASTSAMRRAPRCSRIVSTTARYSRASSRARGVGSGLVDRLDLHVQGALAPSSPVPTRPRLDAADHQREGAVGQLAGVLDRGDRADRARTGRRPAARARSGRRPRSAAAPARFASSVSSAIVTTICGNTTPWVSGSRGRS